MKFVQVGILVALLVCAGLLYRIYRVRQAPPAASSAEAAAVQTTAPTPALQAPDRTPTPVPVMEAAPRLKPTPSRRAPAPEPAEEVARNRAPEPDPLAAQPPPVQAAPLPAPEAAPAPSVLSPAAAEAQPPEPRGPHQVTIPAGTLITVRLADSLASNKNHPGDAFSATLDRPLVVDGFVIAERGARAEGRVAETEPSGAVKGSAGLTVHLIELHTSDGQDVAISTDDFTSRGATASGRQSGEKVAGGAVLGAVIGAIAGGGRGAAIGAGAGGAAGGGVAAATRGKPAQLPVESLLTFRLDKPVTLTERVQ
jgi:hypothetical protein